MAAGGIASPTCFTNTIVIHTRVATFTPNQENDDRQDSDEDRYGNEQPHVHCYVLRILNLTRHWKEKKCIFSIYNQFKEDMYKTYQQCFIQ